MITELLGILCDSEACGDADGYKGLCLDIGIAAPNFPAAADIWIVLQTTVAADYGNSDENYDFQLHMGTGTDGTDINAGAKIIQTTSLLAGDDTRLATAGEFIWRHSLPYECSFQGLSADNRRYLQLYYAQTGTSNSISVDFIVSPSKPRTDFNMQVESSGIGVPS